MDISELSFGAIRKIERMKEDALEKSSHVEVVYKSRKNRVFNALISDGYLVLDTERETKEYFDYLFYKATDKLLGASIDKILMDLVGHDKDYILKNKVISITDVPYDFEDVFEALTDSDGYFDKVDIGNGVFRQALDMHGFTVGAGVNGHYSSGTSKLATFSKSNRDYEVVETLTGKTQEENDLILTNAHKQEELHQMHKIAKKYGYIVSTDSGRELV